LLLVAFLLVSAIPFQAFASEPHTDAHYAHWEPDGQTGHYIQCDVPDCALYDTKINPLPHDYDSNGQCKTCGYYCTHPVAEEVVSTYKPATCTEKGRLADKKCQDCGVIVQYGTEFGPLGHDFVDGYCTRCSLADPNAHNSSTHALSSYQSNATSHWMVCTVPTCSAAVAGTHFNEVAHTFNPATGECTVCGYKCLHPAGFTDKPGTATAATCVTPGKQADQYCATCGFVHTTGAVIPATGIHDFGADGKCKNCSAVKPENSYTLTLNPNGGTVNGGVSLGVTVTKNSPIISLPDPVRTGFNFVGWFVVDQSGNMTNTQIRVGQNYPYDSDMTVAAKWVDKTYVLTVRRVLNGDLSTAKTIDTANVPEGTALLSYLNANVASLVNAELALTPGYSWQNNYWRDYSGTQPLTSQSDIMNQAQTVYVNFVSNTYTLSFDANGGTVTPITKSVTFGSKVGTLPTPYKEGSVFMGWRDASGIVYTADTIYNVAGNTSLTAVWQDEALVILYIYVNGEFSACDRMIVMDGYVKNNNISRADVYTEVVKYYTPASGTLSIAGLFDEYTWSSYRLNTSKAGTENIEVTSSHLNKIYVMVNNANTGITVLPTTPNTTVPANGFWVRDLSGNLVWYPAGSTLPAGTGYWIYDANGNPNIWVITSSSTIPTYIYVGSNPKTGDTAKIEIAAAVMVLAAAALITVMALRKKKSV
ncbi:MAG: InlB B-repeat-containing protein, partial [Faecousia sp.]